MAPGSKIEDGAPAKLLCRHLSDLGVRYTSYDPVVYGHDTFRGMPTVPSVFVLAVPHEQFLGLTYPPGSVVVDPHGLVKDQDGITVIRVGRR